MGVLRDVRWRGMDALGLKVGMGVLRDVRWRGMNGCIRKEWVLAEGT